MKGLLIVLLKLAVSGGLLYYLMKGQDLGGDILPRLRLMLVHWDWLVAGLACIGISTWLHAWRWQALLKAQGEPAPAGLINRVNLVANFFNLSPLGSAGGDAYRLLALLSRSGYRRLPVVVSLVLDHMVGMASVALVFLLFGAAFADHWSLHSQAVRSLVSGFSVFMVVSLLFMLLSVWSFSPGLYAWGEQRMKFLRHEKVKQFCSACDAIRHSWKRTLESLIASVAMYFAHFLAFYCSARAISESPPLLDVMAAMPVVDSLAGLPISFAGLGVREKTFETLMGALSGMGEAAAVSASLAGWLMQVFWAMIGGLLFLFERRSRPASPSP